MSTTKLTLAQKVANLNTPLTWDNIQNKPPFGTEANTILEGSKFIEGLGVNGYGGTIQDPGQKVAGKCYFDINTKSLFLCKTTNNLTSPNSDYFTSFDNKSLLNKLENLYKNMLYHPDRWGPVHEDSLITTGLYQLVGVTSKLVHGFCGSQAFILVLNTGLYTDDWITQIAFSYYSIETPIAFRTRRGSDKQWTPWRYVRFHQ